MANFGPSKTWTDGEILSHTDLNAALLDIINNVTNNNIDADNIDETDDYTWSGANSFVGGHSIKVLSNAASSIVTGTTLEWDPGDGGQMTDNSSGISLDFKLPDAADNQDVFASIAAICLDDAAGSEDGELSFRVATAGTNTEKMTLSSTALTVTPAITASGGITGSVTSSNVSITGGSITGITDIAIADGGTGASTAAAARTNLGLEIGVDVQAYDAELQALSGLTPTDSNIIVGNGSTFVTESGATARTSLGLGSIATQSASAVSITGGSLTGMTSYSGGTISGTTGTFSGDLTVDTSSLKVDSSNNRVGVGVASPKDTLHVKIGTNLNWQFGYPNSSVTTLAALNDAESAYVTARIDAGTLELNGQSGGDVNLGAGVLVVDTSADRVGINTASPQVDFHVNNASTNGVARISTSNAGSYAQLQLVNQSGNYWYQTIVSDNSYRLYNGSDRLTLTSAGLLGLGMTSPQAMLDTTGVFRSTGGTGVPSTGTGAEFFIDSGVAYFQGYNRTGSAFIETRLRGNPIVLDGGSVGIGTVSPSALIHAQAADGTAGGAIKYTATSVASAYLSASPDGAVLATDTAGIVFRTGITGDDPTDTGTERARIDSSGNLLVGTTSVYGTNKLNVNGGIAIDGRNATTPGLCEKGDVDTGIYWPTTNTIAVTTGGTERVRILSSGGITFNGDTTTANALDDYEEGTWTPTIDGFTGTYAQNSGSYVKIGQLVHASCYITLSSLTSMDGTPLDVSGFPFAAENSTSVWYAGNFGNFGFLDLPTGTVDVAWNIGNGLTTSTCRAMKDNADYENVLNTAITSTSFFMYVSWTYRTA